MRCGTNHSVIDGFGWAYKASRTGRAGAALPFSVSAPGVNAMVFGHNNAVFITSSNAADGYVLQPRMQLRLIGSDGVGRASGEAEVAPNIASSEASDGYPMRFPFCDLPHRHAPRDVVQLLRQRRAAAIRGLQRLHAVREGQRHWTLTTTKSENLCTLGIANLHGTTLNHRKYIPDAEHLCRVWAPGKPARFSEQSRSYTLQRKIKKLKCR